MRFIILAFAMTAMATDATAKQIVTLKDVLGIAYSNNPEIRAANSIAKAEDSLVTAEATLEDPMIGVSTLDRGNRTQYGTITQNVRFPTKYYYQAKAQQSLAMSHKNRAEAQRLNIRQKVASLYYSIYAVQKITRLTNSNIGAVREFARVAERKYAAGRATQSDSMKAHFELTNLELDLIRLRQEDEALQEELRSHLNDADFAKLEFGDTKLKTPIFNDVKLKVPAKKLTKVVQENSPAVQSAMNQLEYANYKYRLAKWEFAPDIQLQYQQRISGDPEDSKIYSVGLKFPLWFWKKGSEASAAGSKRVAQESRLTHSTNKAISNITNLRGKTEVGSKTLKIYNTSLIPQAQGAYNSSKAGYRANKVSFLDLLDSERSLYRVKTGFYKTLRQYVSNITALEAQLGILVSDIESEVQDEAK